MNAKIRQSVYALGTIVTGIVSIALIWGGISAESAAGITQALTGLLTLLGGTAVTATAGTVLTKQKHNPVEQVLSGIEAITTAREQAQADIDKITQGVTDKLGDIPVAGPLVQQIIEQARAR